MKSSNVKFLEVGTKLERTVGMLYELFSQQFPDDAEFWKLMYADEIAHAEIFEKKYDLLFGNVDAGEHPVFSDESITSMQLMNGTLDKLINRSILKQPTRAEAFNIGLAVEKHGIEDCFQRISVEKDGLGGNLDGLISGCQDHFKKILNYMEANEIELLPALGMHWDQVTTDC